MDKCNIDSRGIQKQLGGLFRTYKNNELSPGEFLKQLSTLYKTLTDTYITDNDYQDMAEIIKNSAERWGILTQFPNVFTLTTIQDSLKQTKDNIQQVNYNDISVDQLSNPEYREVNAQASKEFLYEAYGTATSVLNYVQHVTNSDLFDCLFVNRYSDNFKSGTVNTNSEMNSNIRNYQEQLLSNITTYLNRERVRGVNASEELKELLRTARLYDQDGEYTGILERLSNMIERNILNKSPDNLIRLYSMMTDSNLNSSQRNSAKEELDAYNSTVILRNFDSYLLNYCGNIMQIKNFNLMTEDKYKIDTKTTKIATTWRNSENIDVSSESDFVTRQAVNTSPLYLNQANTPMIGRYLNFNDFQHIIGKIKDLANNRSTANIRFDSNYIQRLGLENKGFTREELATIQDMTLRELICNLVVNSGKYSNLLFRILSNKTIQNKETDLFKDFTRDELNKLYSLNLALFNGPKSIRELSDPNSERDYYSNIVQTVNSIFEVKLAQYYKGRDGNITIRPMLDSSIDNYSRGIELTINSRNKAIAKGKWDSFKNQYNLRENALGNNVTSILFDIPNTELQITVTAAGQVTINSPSNFSIAKDYKIILPFIDDILQLNLSNQPEFQSEVNARLGNDQPSSTYRQLLNFASRVVLNTYIYNKQIEANNITLDSLVHSNDIPVLRSLATARANYLGTTSSTQVKDGEGNTQSQQTLSRLLGSYQQQYELQERNEDSATKDLLILTNPALSEGIYTLKEYYDPDTGSVQANKMSINEMITSGLVYDFAGGLMEKDSDKNPINGNGKVLFLPSVNADKNTVGRKPFDLNQQVIVINDGVQQTKEIRDLNSQERKALIAHELGNVYSNMLNSVMQDVYQLFQSARYLKIPLPTFTNKNINTIWKEFNEFVYANIETIQQNYGSYIETPKDYLDYLINKVNESSKNLDKPLRFIDQVHYRKTNKGDLYFNQVILAQIARFQPEVLSTEFDFTIDEVKSFPSGELFWLQKKAQVLTDLLKENFKLNTTNTKQPELAWIRSKYSNEQAALNWIDASGNLILAKINGRPITSTRDFIKSGELDYERWILDNINDIQLNPLIEQFNDLDYLFTQEFMLTTVGSFVAHPEKSGQDDVLIQEAFQLNAQNKRNVSMTAAMHEFVLNLLNGCPRWYNIAVIEDIEDFQGTITGVTSSIKAFDGGTFVHPGVVYLENNSLGGAKAGMTKKQFVHYKDERTGTGGIIKTAGFSITNEFMRNSPLLQRLMKKMTDFSWYNAKRNKGIETLDITQSWNGKIEYEPIFYKQNGKYYKVIKIQNLKNNYYSRTIQEVDEHGNPVGKEIQEEATPIYSNYALWKYFGGEWSMELKNNYLVPSESSIRNLVKAMNGVMILKKGVTVPQTQEDVIQPLKHSDVHYLCTEGAVKQGAANINSAKIYNDINDEIPLNFFEINLYQAGIQLDKEHHADESELSLMTQVMSAAAARGYTFDQALELYEALRRQTEIKSKEYFQALEEVFKVTDPRNRAKAVEKLREVVMKSIIKTLANQSSNQLNFAQIMARDLIKQARNGKDIKFADALLPLSDSTIAAKVTSSISVFLTNTGIKQKIPGTLSVLTPSFELLKLYNGRKYESFTDPKKELEQLQREQIPIYWDDKPSFIPGILSFNNIPIIYDNTPVGQNVATGIQYDGNTLTININILEVLAQQAGENTNKYITRKLFAAILSDVYPKLENESNEEYMNRLDWEANRRISASSSISNIELGRKYIITREVYNDQTDTYDSVTSVEDIQTPDDYYAIQNDDSIVRITEDIVDGRNLAGYNVRFETDQGSFQLWDLDSARYLFKLDKLQKKWNDKSLQELNDIIRNFLEVTPKEELTEFNKNTYLKRAITLTRRRLQSDLQNLSRTRVNILEQFDTFLAKQHEAYSKATDEVEKQKILESIIKWYNVKFGTGDGIILRTGGEELKIDETNKNDIIKRVANLIENAGKVKINGDYHSIDYESIKIQPYEVIMPKVFATSFGLTEQDDVNSIVEDKDFFIKQYIRLQNLNEPIPEAYAIGLKSSNGNHHYLLPSDLLDTQHLRKINNLMYIDRDGKRYRVREDQSIMYELIPGTEIYLDSQNNEVIATDDLDYYIKQFSFDSIKLSPQLVDKPGLYTILDILKKSKSRKVKYYYNYFTQGTNSSSDIIKRSNDLHNITLENYQSLPETDPIIRQGRAKHSSFLRSLDIIAARIPAQCMQSYMPMKVVGFENPDVNNAYVSTYQLLLQGSK